MEYKKARRDLVAAVVLLAFSVIYFTQTFKIRQTSLISISSASIPRICALLVGDRFFGPACSKRTASPSTTKTE